MELLKVDTGGMTCQLSTDEVAWLLNALGQAFEHLKEWEFQTHMGAELNEAQQLQEQLRAAYQQIPPLPQT